jgi:hypothetical protein
VIRVRAASSQVKLSTKHWLEVERRPDTKLQVLPSMLRSTALAPIITIDSVRQRG